MAPFRKLRTKLGLRREKVKKTNPYATIGRYTYGITPDTIFHCNENNPIVIGSFCSVAHEVVLLNRANHPTNIASTFPMREEFAPISDDRNNLLDQGGIRIGNDVWIGRRAMILPAVKVGNGAVIGAGAVVTKDVPPYAIVAGNPAKIIRYRFDDHIISKLQSIEWWNWTDDKIKENLDDFFLPIEEFVHIHATI